MSHKLSHARKESRSYRTLPRAKVQGGPFFWEARFASVPGAMTPGISFEMALRPKTAGREFDSASMMKQADMRSSLHNALELGAGAKRNLFSRRYPLLMGYHVHWKMWENYNYFSNMRRQNFSVSRRYSRSPGRIFFPSYTGTPSFLRADESPCFIMTNPSSASGVSDLLDDS